MNKKMIVLEDTAEQCFRTGRDSELFLNPETGDLWKCSDHPKFHNPDMELDDALASEADGKLLRLPKSRDLHELDLMDEFIDYTEDGLQRDLLTALKQPNPFQSFRLRLKRAGMLDAYYQYRNERGGEIIEEWCQANEIPYRHQISLQDIQENWSARPLYSADAAKILRLAQTNADFYALESSVPSLKNIKADLVRTPSRTSLEQKYYIGFYIDGKLIAVMDLILDYPQDLSAWIQFFMIDGRHQHQGLGTRILKEAENMLAQAGFAHLAVGVRPDNEAAVSFWKKNGYQVQNGSSPELWILSKEQELPEEIYEPEWEDQTTEWTF